MREMKIFGACDIHTSSFPTGEYENHTINFIDASMSSCILCSISVRVKQANAMSIFREIPNRIQLRSHDL